MNAAIGVFAAIGFLACVFSTLLLVVTLVFSVAEWLEDHRARRRVSEADVRLAMYGRRRLP